MLQGRRHESIAMYGPKNGKESRSKYRSSAIQVSNRVVVMFSRLNMAPLTIVINVCVRIDP